MFRKGWTLVKLSVSGFMEDGALSRGAAIAFFAITSIGPVLLIVVAIAGLAYGQAAAQGAVEGQLGGMMGNQSAGMVQSLLRSSSNHGTGVLATVVGIVMLIVTASGAFGEIQTALNVIWKAKPEGQAVWRLIWARVRSLCLVAALGALLLASLVISTALKAAENVAGDALPFGETILQIANFVISFVLIACLFGVIYRVLPDRDIAWRDVVVGGAITALLFTIGKSLIGLYLGSSSMASGYGAAGGLIILLLWIYYSAQIFLLGAEFTRAYAVTHGSLREGGAAGC